MRVNLNYEATDYELENRDSTPHKSKILVFHSARTPSSLLVLNHSSPQVARAQKPEMISAIFFIHVQVS